MDTAAMPLVRSQGELGQIRNGACKQSKWKKVCFHSDRPEAHSHTSEPPYSERGAIWEIWFEVLSASNVSHRPAVSLGCFT